MNLCYKRLCSNSSRYNSSWSGLSSMSVSELDSWSLNSVTSPLRHNASDLSSVCLSLLYSSNSAEYCSVVIISRRFVIAMLDCAERFIQFQARSDETNCFNVIGSVGASRRNANARLEE
ncbi:hypothetical protein AVEN_127838-1 [Araneus ventricosus]|uniref:Uncharacterized protein n=1 Tax=Araneus ventricosus TaxID=182803 RepID=A0A4Y1ZZN4_ARAVE|nr:hypothetical protein AVEN_127838-1 [Araneus ventricosus]